MTTVPATPTASSLRTARRRDRRVYTRSHPVLFALLAAARHRAVIRVGGAVLVHGTEPYRQALTRLPLDRTAAGTTGGAARELSYGGTLFDQEGAGHRAGRRALAEELGAAGVERLRPVWREILARRLAPLGAGRDVDLVPLAREVAGATVRALLHATGEPEDIAVAAAAAAAATVRDHLPGPRRPGSARAAAPRCATTCPAHGGRAAHVRPPRRPHGWRVCSPLPTAKRRSRPCGPCSRSPPSTPLSRPSRGPPPGAPTRGCGNRPPMTGCVRRWWASCCG
ncbi:hypothetical protein [Streptomyces barkulensis]|uniref:hypothetical protein n=1 Tax=Streptomyces barkulensis TaxID=1257026 RepID=UPI0019D14DC1|nr:hypothetical protein [Streptomyces barkulensis]